MAIRNQVVPELDTFLYILLDEKLGFVRPISIGEEMSEELKLADPNITRVDLFDSNQPLKDGVFDREDLIQIFLD